MTDLPAAKQVDLKTILATPARVDNSEGMSYLQSVPRRIVFAGGVRVGLARGFPREAARVSEDGTVVVGPDGEPIIDTVTDLPASERLAAPWSSLIFWASEREVRKAWDRSWVMASAPRVSSLVKRTAPSA